MTATDAPPEIVAVDQHGRPIKRETEPHQGPIPEAGERFDDGGPSRPRVAARTRPLRALINVHPGDIDLAADSLCELLPNLTDIYQRSDGSLVHVIRLDREEKAGRARYSAGTPIIRALVKAGMRERACKIAEWRKPNVRAKGRLQTCDPPDTVIDAVMARGSWPGVPSLVGVSEIPILRLDGSVFEADGYDAETGYLHVPSMRLPPMSTAPTKADAAEGLSVLRDAFIDFPWATSAAMSIPIAAILTLISRSAIRGPVPLIALEANSPGSGKSLAADVVSIVATGRDAARATFGGDDEELEKTLAGVAMRGSPLILFDNIGDGVALRGAPLDKALTGRSVFFRKLGTNDTPELPWSTLIMATGNNLVIGSDDIRRRVLLGRLDSPYEDPAKRPIDDFKHPERAGRLADWVKEHRPELVCAAFDVMRAVLLAGAPQPEGRGAGWGSFEAWEEIIAGAIVWAGGASPLEGRPSVEGGGSPERAALGVILRYIERLDEGAGVTVARLVQALYSPEYMRREEAPSPDKDEARAAIEELVAAKPTPDKKALGKKLAGVKGRPIDGLRLEPRSFTTANGEQRTTDKNGLVHWTVRRASPGPGPRRDRSVDRDEERDAIRGEERAPADGGRR
jgi:hypothetical protein